MKARSGQTARVHSAGAVKIPGMVTAFAVNMPANDAPVAITWEAVSAPAALTALVAQILSATVKSAATRMLLAVSAPPVDTAPAVSGPLAVKVATDIKPVMTPLAPVSPPFVSIPFAERRPVKIPMVAVTGPELLRALLVIRPATEAAVDTVRLPAVLMSFG